MPARTTGPSATATPPSDAPVAGAPEAGKWSRRVQSFGRWGVLAIPVYALFAGLTQRDRDAFSTDPAVYAHYREHGRFTPWELVATLGLGFFGLLALIALTALLIRGRGRTFAVIGLLVGIAGSTALMITIGSVILRSDQVRSAFFGGHWSKIAINAEAHGSPAGIIVAGGAITLMLGWMLLGVAVWRTDGLNRADGLMLIVSAPLLYIGGLALRVLPTMGSFLLLAAGLGIAAQAGRAILALDAPSPVAVPVRSRTYSRLVGADVYATDDLEEFERDFDGTAESDAAAAAGAAKAGSPRHAGRGVIGRITSTRGIPIAWPVTRRRRADASRPAAESDTARPDPTTGTARPDPTTGTARPDPTTGTDGGKPAHGSGRTADAPPAAGPATGAPRHAAGTARTTGDPAAPAATPAAADSAKPKSGLMGALAAILNGTMTLGRKDPEPTPTPTGRSAVAGRPAAQFGLDKPDRARLDGTKAASPKTESPKAESSKAAPPTISTTPVGRATTPSLTNRVPGAPTPASAKATNADPKPAGKRGGGAKGTNAKGGKGKPGQD